MEEWALSYTLIHSRTLPASQRLLYELAAAIIEKRFKKMYPEYKYTPSQPKNMSEIISHKIRQAAATNSDINLRHATAIHNSANIGNNNINSGHAAAIHIKLGRLRPQTATRHQLKTSAAACCGGVCTGVNYIINAKIGRVEARIDGVEKRVDGVEKRIDGVEKRIDGVEKRIDGVDKRVDDNNENAKSPGTSFSGDTKCAATSYFNNCSPLQSYS